VNRDGNRDREGGTVTVMLVGFFLVIAALTAAVVDASAAFLTRQQLNSLADGAALAAIDGAQGQEVYEQGLGELAVVDPQVASASVADYLAAVGAHDDHASLSYDVVSDGTRVTVTVSARLDLPIVPPGWDADTLVVGRSSAIAPVV
jgi:uncharacterized membrane protein